MHLYFPCSSVWLTVNFHPAGLAWVAAERFAYRFEGMKTVALVTAGPAFGEVVFTVLTGGALAVLRLNCRAHDFAHEEIETRGRLITRRYCRGLGEIVIRRGGSLHASPDVSRHALAVK